MQTTLTISKSGNADDTNNIKSGNADDTNNIKSGNADDT